MDGFENLLALAGTWEGDNRVQPELGGPIDESRSRLIVTPILANTFVRIDQTWSWKSEPQSGSMWIGYDPKTATASVHWIDTWHNDRRVMPLSGAFDADGKLAVLGSFPVPNSADWGWRIGIGMKDERLRIDMICLSPAGKEEGYVWGSFARV